MLYNSLSNCLSLVAWYLADAFGHGAVGQEHELLDELVGFLRFLEVNAQWFTLFIYFEAHFHTVEIHGTCSHAVLAENLPR